MLGSHTIRSLRVSAPCLALFLVAPWTFGQSGSWVDVQPIEGVNSSSADWRPIVSEDGLTLVFSSDRPGGQGGADLYVATRDTRDQSFGNVRNLIEVNTAADDLEATLSSDGLRLYFCSDRAGGRGGFDLYVATRSSAAAGEPFGSPEPVDALNTEIDETAPWLSAGEQKLYFARSGQGILVATREGDEFGNVHTVYSTEPYTEWDPTVSSDGSTLFYGEVPESSAFRPGGPGGMDLWKISLTASDQPMAEPVPMASPPNSEFCEGSPSISPDWPAAGAKLYFARAVTCEWLQFDLYEATWQPEPPRGYFGEVVPFAPFAPGAVDGGSFSGDGLAYYLPIREPGGDFDIYRIDRDRVVDSAGHPVPFSDQDKVFLEELSSPQDELSVSIAPDELTIHFISGRPGGNGGNDLWVARRERAVDEEGKRVPFDDPVPMTELNSAAREYGPSLTADGLLICFQSSRPTGLGPAQVWIASRERVVDEAGNRVPFDPPEKLEELSINEVVPVLSPDGLNLFFSSRGRGGLGESDIFRATRAARVDEAGNRMPFEAPVNLGPPVNTPQSDFVAAVTWNWPAEGAQIGFGRETGANLTGYLANWHPLSEPRTEFIRGDCDGDGQIIISDGIKLLNFLFLGHAEPPCAAACDTVGSGELELSSAVSLFDFLFLGRATPPLPFPDCGAGTDLDQATGCENAPALCR